MAIIGNFFKLKSQLSKRVQLTFVFNYLQKAIEKDSIVHKRIFSNTEPSFLKVDIGQGCFALEQVFFTKDRKDCFFESHKKYIDFQLLLSGQEQMEVIDKDNLRFKKYDEFKDFVFYEDTDLAMKIMMKDNDLSIYFPDDAHMGCPFFIEKQLVYKTVVKVPVELVNEI